MKKYKSTRKQGISFLEIVVLIILLTVFIMYLISQFGSFGPGSGGVSGSKGSGSKQPPITQSPVPTQPPTPPQPPIPQNPSKLILEWRDPDNFSEIETKINNQLKPEIRTVIVRTEVMKITTAKEDKLNELIKNKGSEAELKIEQLK